LSVTLQNPPFLEPHYTIAQIAERWGISDDFARDLFVDEPGVLIIYRKRRGKHPYKNLRVPKSVLERVYERFKNGGGNGHT